MTIIAMYKEYGESIFISDFRVTEKQDGIRIQKDISYKLVTFDDRIGLFLAGDVNKWKIAINKIELIKKNITFENVLDEDGILKNTLLDFSLSEDAGNCSALGFIIDTETNQNKVFEIDIKPSWGCILNNVENICCIIKGSGGQLPNLDTKILKLMSNNNEIFDKQEDKLNIKSMVIKNEIKNAISDFSDDGFKDLGISPVFQVSYLDGSTFEVASQDIEGGSFNKESGYIFNYSFELEENKMQLKDNFTEKKVELKDINSISTGLEGSEFNPEKI